jgi:hypothetical protein
MRSLGRLSTLWLVLLAAACSSGGPGSAAPAPAAPPTTSPFEVVTVDDQVLVGSSGITTTEGEVLLAFTADERSCVDATVATTAQLSASIDAAAADPLDPDAEQTLAEIVVGCVPFVRVQPVVERQLVAQATLSAVDPACLDRETASLQDTPDVLAAVLRGDPEALSVVSGTAAVNCR